MLIFPCPKIPIFISALLLENRPCSRSRCCWPNCVPIEQFVVGFPVRRFSYNQRTLTIRSHLFKADGLKAIEKIHIIGIGDDGLDGITVCAMTVIEARIFCCAESTLALVPAKGNSRLAVKANLQEAIDRIQSAKGQSIVILASGDPLFYGVARYLCDKLEHLFAVIPHVSSMQMAFVRVKES